MYFLVESSDALTIVVLGSFNAQNTGKSASRHSHINDDDIGSDFRSNDLDNTTEVGDETIGNHQLGDDIRIRGLQESDAGVVATYAQHLPADVRSRTTNGQVQYPG